MFELVGAPFAHFRVGLDGKNEFRSPKVAGKYARARSNISDDVIRLQSALGAQQIENFRRISRPIADVILHPIGKTRRRIFRHCSLV